MAQRFGGKYSPEATRQDGRDGTSQAPARGVYRGAMRTRAGGRVNLLFIAPLPLIWAAFTTGPTGLLLNLLALGMLLLAAWLTREGILAQEAYEARRVARAPGAPRKLLGSVLTGLGLGLAGFAADGDLFAPVIYAVVGSVLHVMAFGLDPMRDKGMEGIDKMQTDRVARVVDQAEDYLNDMRDAIKRAGDREAEDRVAQFQLSVRDLLRTVEEDPRDLTSARRFMGVYLMGARDATVKYADIADRAPNAEARADYLDLLRDLEENFAAKTRKLLADSNTDLDIEISVLRDRLEREGIRLENADS
ncbi:MAG: 5-bromo-4-chloroindolyl phosphate hydrolysis family protein [Pseudomonadota bacterium]